MAQSGLSKMVIVNGQIQRQGQQGSESASPVSSDALSLCGTAVPRWAIGTLLVMALILGGLKGLFIALFVGGAAVFFSSSSFSIGPSSSTATPRRGGGLSNVRGMGDLPKTVQKSG